MSSRREIVNSEFVDLADDDSVLTRNVKACRTISDLVRSTLGPNGMDKLLVDHSYRISGKYIVTNDGATMLDELSVEDPAAKLVVSAALDQNEVYGDGTTTIAVLVGELLKHGEELIDQGLHPTTIASGYEAAHGRIRTVLDAIAEDIRNMDDLRAVALTAMAGKVGSGDRQRLAELLVQSVDRVGMEEFSEDRIKIITVPGGTINDSGIAEGVILDEEPAHLEMPSRVQNAKVGLISGGIQARTVDDANLAFDTFDQYRSYFDREDEQVDEAVEAVLDANVDALFLSSFLDDRPQEILADAGVLAVRHVDPADLRLLSNATNARIVTGAENVTRRDLGVADQIIKTGIGRKEHLLIEHEDRTETATIVLRAGTEHVLEELERAVEDAVASLDSVLTDRRVVWGGGATEADLCWHLRQYARGVEGKEQLAVKAVADSLEAIPRVLAENAGADPIDRTMELRNEHDMGKIDSGVTRDGDIASMRAERVIDPFQMKRALIGAATEVATRILRIDGLIATEPLSEEEEQRAVDRIDMGEDPDEAVRSVRQV